jgi:hypothetical protein
VLQTRCEQSLHYWCKLHPNGHPTCNGVFPSESDRAKHIRAGRHLDGAIRPYPSGVASGRGDAHDRNLAVVAASLNSVIDANIGAATASPTLRPALNFRMRFADGREYPLPVPAAAWARSQRLPIIYSTPKQIEFILYAYTIGEHAHHQKFSAASARELMVR